MKPVIICFVAGSLLLTGCTPKQGESAAEAIGTIQEAAEVTLEKESETEEETAQEETTEEIAKETAKETAKEETEETTEEVVKDPEVLFFDTFFKDRGNRGFLYSGY